MTWKEALVNALENLNGIAHLKDIENYIVENNLRENLPQNPDAGIRGTLERYSSDSDLFRGEDLFYSVYGKGKGVWGLRSFVPSKEHVDLTQDDYSCPEGRKSLKLHIIRERNPSIILKAKTRFIEQHGKLYCEACGFDFKEVYGELGENFIEAHHAKPIAEMNDGERTNIDDIVMLCSNCHSMIHRKKPWLTKDELNELIQGR
ncbi:MAG: HNH endonuclease [Clostridiales bacterium]|jgi:putative restriction endonuclease|nr:HNH endonuclease [Clostridiales bacterium]